MGISNGGLYYRNADEFGEILRTLHAHPDLQHRLGQNGRAFALAHYTWDMVENKYVEMIKRVLSQSRTGEARTD